LQGDHLYSKKGAKLGIKTKKKDCNARILLRKTISFPEYKVPYIYVYVDSNNLRAESDCTIRMARSRHSTCYSHQTADQS